MLERDLRLVDVPVLICTTSQRQLNQAPILPRTRAWGVMAKPFDVPRLMEMIDSLACGVSYGEPRTAIDEQCHRGRLSPRTINSASNVAVPRVIEPPMTTEVRS